MKAPQEIPNKPIIKKLNEEQIQAERGRILDKQLERKRSLKFAFKKTISSKKSRRTY